MRASKLDMRKRGGPQSQLPNSMDRYIPPPPKNLEVIGAILDHLSQGAFIHAACWAAGVPPKTFQTWRLQDPELNRRVRAAISIAEVEATATLKKTDPKEFLTLRHKHWAKVAKSLKASPEPAVQILLQMPLEARKQEALRLMDKVQMLTSTLDPGDSK